MLVLVVVVAGACQSQDAVLAPEPLPRAAVQDLRVAVGEDPFLTGEQPRFDLGVRADDLNPGIFETLTALTPDVGLVPGLAVRWRSETPTRWRFELREGIRFHDGTPLTAAAVVETIERSVGGPGGATTVTARGVPEIRGLEPGSAAADGDGAVVVSLSEVNLRLPEQLANPRLAVRAPGTEAGDGSTPALTPTGSGPFRFDSYRPDEELVVVANPDYWGGPPELSSISFRFGPPDDASRLLAVRDVDLVGQIPAQDLAAVSGERERLATSEPARSVFLLLNRGGVGEWDTLGDDAIRRAVALAIDREQLVEAGWPDAGDVNTSLIPAVVLDLSAEDVDPPAQDTMAARTLLDEGGWAPEADGIRARNGERLELVLVMRQAERVPDEFLELLERQLADVGVGLDVEAAGSPGSAPPLERLNAATFDLFLDEQPLDDANPCSLCRLFVIRPGGDLSVSGAVGAGAAADALFEAAYGVPTVAGARRSAAQLMQVVVSDEVVAVPLASQPNRWLVSSRVQGFQPASVAGTQPWTSVWLAP